jgi:hypothetical protein
MLMVESGNKIVHGMWIGDSLGAIELLTLKSFLKAGHEFHLWLYAPLITEVPTGVIIEDAQTVFPREQVFKYSDAMDMEHGKGSYAGFSDVFRYKLLYEHGGWWSDMDVTCLKQFHMPEPYFFRNHWELPVVGNVMKVPRYSKLMAYCLERATAEIDGNNTIWNKPIQILCDGVQKFQMQRFVHYGCGNIDHVEEIWPYLHYLNTLPANWYFVHWINAWLRSSDTQIQSGSALYQLLQKYGLEAKQ